MFPSKKDKIAFLCAFTLFNVFDLRSQIIEITPDSIYNCVMRSPLPSIIQFWVPNCENAEQIVEEFKVLQEKYADEIDFYFVGLTDKPELVSNLQTKTNHKGKLYVTAKIENLLSRKAVFTSRLNELFKVKNRDFNTMYIKNQTFKYSTKQTSIDLAKVEKLLFRKQ